MFFDLIDITVSYVQYLMLLVRISPESYPRYYTESVESLYNFFLGIVPIDESDRYNNLLEISLPEWIPLDVRLQVLLTAAAAPVALATLGILGVRGKYAYVWVMATLGSLFMIAFGGSLVANVSALVEDSGVQPNAAIVCLTCGVPIFLALVTVGLVAHRYYNRKEIRRETTLIAIFVAEEERRRRNQSIAERLICHEKLSVEALAREQVYQQRKAEYIAHVHVGHCVLYCIFATCLFIGGLVMVGCIPIGPIENQQSSTVFRAIGSVLLVFSLLSVVWVIMSLSVRGRTFKTVVSSVGRNQLINVLLMCSFMLYTVAVTNIATITYCKETICEPGMHLPIPGSIAATGKVGVNESTIFRNYGVQCLTNNVLDYPQRCSADLLAEFSKTTSHEARLLSDPWVRCNTVRGAFQVGTLLLSLTYIIMLPILQFRLSRHATTVLENDFPLEYRFKDVFTTEEVYQEKVNQSKNVATFLYRAYRKKFNHYRQTFLLQRIILATVSCLSTVRVSRRSPQIGMILFVVVCLMASVLAMVLKPFSRPTETVYFPTLQLVIVCTALLGLWGNISGPDHVPTAVGVFVAVCIFIVPVITIILGTILTLHMERRRYELMQRRLEEDFENHLHAGSTGHNRLRQAVFSASENTNDVDNAPHSIPTSQSKGNPFTGLEDESGGQLFRVSVKGRAPVLQLSLNSPRSSWAPRLQSVEELPPAASTWTRFGSVTQLIGSRCSEVNPLAGNRPSPKGGPSTTLAEKQRQVAASTQVPTKEYSLPTGLADGMIDESTGPQRTVRFHTVDLFSPRSHVDSSRARSGEDDLSRSRRSELINWEYPTEGFVFVPAAYFMREVHSCGGTLLESTRGLLSRNAGHRLSRQRLTSNENAVMDVTTSKGVVAPGSITVEEGPLQLMCPSQSNARASEEEPLPSEPPSHTTPQLTSVTNDRGSGDRGGFAETETGIELEGTHISAPRAQTWWRRLSSLFSAGGRQLPASQWKHQRDNVRIKPSDRLLTFEEVCLRRREAQQRAATTPLTAMATERKTFQRPFWGDPTNAMLGVVSVSGSTPPWYIFCSAPHAPLVGSTGLPTVLGAVRHCQEAQRQGSKAHAPFGSTVPVFARRQGLSTARNIGGSGNSSFASSLLDSHDLTVLRSICCVAATTHVSKMKEKHISAGFQLPVADELAGRIRAARATAEQRAHNGAGDVCISDDKRQAAVTGRASFASGVWLTKVPGVLASATAADSNAHGTDLSVLDASDSISFLSGSHGQLTTRRRERVGSHDWHEFMLQLIREIAPESGSPLGLVEGDLRDFHEDIVGEPLPAPNELTSTNRETPIDGSSGHAVTSRRLSNKSDSHAVSLTLRDRLITGVDAVDPDDDDDASSSSTADNCTMQELRCHFLLRKHLVNMFWMERGRLAIVQRSIDRKINGTVRTSIVLFFLIFGCIASVALALLLSSLLTTGDATFIGDRRRSRPSIHNELAGYASWDEFTKNCCCFSETDLKATFPFYALDVENWHCANGITKERVRRDAYTGLVRDGYQVRPLCGMSFINKCELHIAYGIVYVAQCNESISVVETNLW